MINTSTMILNSCYMAEHHACNVGLEETGDTDLMGGSRTQGVGSFLQDGGAGDYIVWVGDVGPFGVDGKDGRGDTHGVPATDHGEASKVIRRRDMGDAGGGRHKRDSGNPVSEDLRRYMAGNRGAVGGATSLI